MVAFDHCAGVAVDRNTFNDVGVGGALREKTDVFDLHRGIVEYADEFVTDDLAFLFRFRGSGELVEKTAGCIDVDKLHPKRSGEKVLHPFRLIFAEKAVVDENTGEIVADRFMDQGGCHGGVHSSAEAENDLLSLCGFADFTDTAFDERFHGPGAGTAADFHREIADQFGSAVRVHHFGVELNAVYLLFRMAYRSEFGIAGFGGGDEPIGQSGDFVPV